MIRITEGFHIVVREFVSHLVNRTLHRYCQERIQRCEQEKERKIAAIKARLTRQSKMDGIVLATVTALSVLALAVLLVHLSGLVEPPDLR